MPAYQALEAFLENPDGSMRIPGTAFWLLSLDLAMKNVEHDEPGYSLKNLICRLSAKR